MQKRVLSSLMAVLLMTVMIGSNVMAFGYRGGTISENASYGGEYRSPVDTFSFGNPEVYSEGFSATNDEPSYYQGGTISNNDVPSWSGEYRSSKDVPEDPLVYSEGFTNEQPLIGWFSTEIDNYIPPSDSGGGYRRIF